MIRVLHDDGMSAFIGDDLLQIRQVDILVDHHQLFGLRKRQGFSMIGIRHADRF